MRRRVERVSRLVKRIAKLQLIGNESRAQCYNEGLMDAIHIVEKYFDQPTLNENQQIVLEYLKKMCPPKLDVSAMVTVYCLVDDNINDNWQDYSEKIPGFIEALQKLTIAEENQVLQAFSQWALEQEEEE